MLFYKKIALVTGASRGIGCVIANMLAENGATVIGTSTSENGVKIIDTYLGNKGKGILLDVLDKESISFCFKKIYYKFGNIDILINNAGIAKDNIILYMDDKNWRTVIDINLTSVFYMSKLVIKPMMRNRYGRIINISSMVGFTGNFGQTNYSAAKSGLVGFSKSLALEVASKGITVNLIAPGFINTDMTKNLTDKQKDFILSKIPINRFGDPKDVAHVVEFIASEKSGYITGQTIHVNGGMYMA